MANRITPVSVQLKVHSSQLQKASKSVKKSDVKVEAVDEGTVKSATVVPWATAAGHSLYHKVQNLPESGITGNPEKTSSNKEYAKEQGIGRKVDRYA